jgi:hypothetical protein
MMYLFLILFFGGIVLLFLWVFRSSKQLNIKKQKLYKEFADKKGLVHSINTLSGIDYNKIEGILDTHKVQMFELKVQKAKRRRLATNINFMNVPIPFNFRIDKKDIFNRPGNLFGMHKIKAGNRVLDKYFDFRTSSEYEFEAMMTPEVQNKLMDIKNELDLSSTIYARNGTLTFATSGGFLDEKRFQAAERILNLMLKLIPKSI